MGATMASITKSSRKKTRTSRKEADYSAPTPAIAEKVFNLNIPRILLTRADIEIRKKKYYRARQFLRVLLSIFPDNREAEEKFLLIYALEGEAHLRKGNIDRALEHIKNFIDDPLCEKSEQLRATLIVRIALEANLFKKEDISGPVFKIRGFNPDEYLMLNIIKYQHPLIYRRIKVRKFANKMKEALAKFPDRYIDKIGDLDLMERMKLEFKKGLIKLKSLSERGG